MRHETPTGLEELFPPGSFIGSNYQTSSLPPGERRREWERESAATTLLGFLLPYPSAAHIVSLKSSWFLQRLELSTRKPLLDNETHSSVMSA